MNHNHQNNKRTPWTPILVIALAVIALGYFLFKSSPQQNMGNQTVNNNDMNSMHTPSSGATNSPDLNGWVGKPMPSVSLVDKDGKTYTAESFKGKTTVLFFSEGLMCYPACWNQIASFGSDQRFNNNQVQAISVVADSSSDWQKAIAKMPSLASALTLFDTSAASSRKLGLLNTSSSMHKGSLPGHTYVIIDKEGVVRFVYDDPNMAIANDLLMKKIAELK